MYLNILHLNYVPRIWRYSLINVVKCPAIMENVWIENGEIVWVDDAFTDHYMENLVDEDFDEGSIKLKVDHQDDSNAQYIDD